MIKRKITSSLAALTVAMCLVLLLVFEKTATNEATLALDLAVKRVIPTLFAFMVISDIIVSMDLLQPLYSLIPTEKIFRLPRSAASVILCGLLCGFPIGASGAAKLYDDKKISLREAEALCTVSSHASPAFLIGVVGTIWGSKSLGIVLYIAEVMFCLISGAIVSRITLPRTEISRSVTSEYTPNPRLISSLCKAVNTASLTCLTVTGNIVFFRVLGSVMSVVIPSLETVFSVVFEFSGGTVYGARVGGVCGGFLTGFAVGFSGLAVLMQCCSFTSPRGIKLSCYIITKAVEGVVLGLTAALYIRKHRLVPTEGAFILFANPISEKSLLILCIPAVLFLLTSRLSKINNFTHGS